MAKKKSKTKEAKDILWYESELMKAKEDVEDLEWYIGEFTAFLPIAVCTLSAIGIIIDVNKSFQELTGYKEIEINGEPIDTVFLEKGEIEKIVQEVVKKDVIKGRELTLLSKEKNKIPVSIFVSARKDREGDYTGCFIGIIDITEVKKLQEGLEQKIKARTKELQERVDELERFRRLTVGRELKMVEMKETIKALEEKIKEPKEKSKIQNQEINNEKVI